MDVEGSKKEEPATPGRAARMATDDGLLYLIKWNNLSYAHATWESSADLRDDAALKAYHDRVAAGHRAAKVSTKF